VPAPHTLAKVNLLPKDAFEVSALGKFLKWSLTVGRVLVVLTEFVVILAFGSRFWFDKRHNDLIEVIDQKQLVVESYVEIEKQIREVLARQDGVDRFLKENVEIDLRFSELRKYLPIGTVLDELSLEPKSIKMAGLAGSESNFSQALVGFAAMKDVVSVSVGKIEFDQQKGGIGFEVNSRIEKEKR